MHVSLFLIGFVADLRAIANPQLSDLDLFASIPSNSQNFYGSDENLFDGSSADDIDWINDPLLAGDDFQWGSEDVNVLLGSSEPDDSYELASSAPCNGPQSSSDLDDIWNILAARDLADQFPGLQQLTTPLNELRESGQCGNPESPTGSENPSPSDPLKIRYNAPWPEDTPPDLFILTGLKPEECPDSNPIPLYCEGPWAGLNVLGCSQGMFTFTTSVIIRPPRNPGSDDTLIHPQFQTP